MRDLFLSIVETHLDELLLLYYILKNSEFGHYEVIDFIEHQFSEYSTTLGDDSELPDSLKPYSSIP
jgi:hypothetical protein